MRRAILGLALLALCGSAHAQEKPRVRELGLPFIEQIGEQMYRQDMEAAIATDLLRARNVDFTGKDVRGWVVIQEPTGDRVRFVRAAGDGFEAAYDISFVAGEKPAVSVPSDRTLSDDERGQLAARTLAIESLDGMCTQALNVVVLRDDATKNWLVWTLAATTEADVMVVGGHTRFVISPDGATVIENSPLSASCIEISLTKAEAVAVTHVVSNTPVETHVFLNLLHRKSIAVGTMDKGIWMVKGGKIVRIGTAK